MFNQQTTQKAFLDLMEEQDCDSWLRAKGLIDSLLKSAPFLSERFSSSIKNNLRKVKNILMLIYLYSLDNEPVVYSFQKDRYAEKFRQICQDRQSTYAQVFLWITGKRDEEQKAIVQFIIEYAPTFFHKNLFVLTPAELDFLIRVFNQMEVKTNRQIHLVTEFISILQKVTVGQLSQYDCKQNAIILSILRVVSSQLPGKGHFSILIDDFLMGKPEEQIVDKFCFIHWSFLSELTTWQLLKAWHQLFLRGANAHLLELVIRTTNILAEGQEFFKLKQTYAQFVLPVVAKRMKGCVRQGVEKAVLNLCEMYTTGFNLHCDIGEEGAQCLITNIQAVTSQNYRKRWMELAFFTAKQQSTIRYIQRSLKNKGIDQKIIQECKNPFIAQQPWNITTRNIKEHKTYKKYQSKYKGISNRQFQCYIISVIQALFMTKKLPILLKKATKYNRCVNQLKDVFRDLQEQVRYRIKVNDLQRTGPTQFAQSQMQEDAQQYLLALMNNLEQYFKQVKLQNQFKEIFQISSQTDITCKQCKHQTSSKQNQYIYTISNKEKLKIENTEMINDFTCASCKKRESIKRTTLTLRSHILIVHINRFSNVEGRIKKQLPSERVLRNFGPYELVGMIFHIGKFVESGHYVYYSKLGPKRWVEFNDQSTSEFDLDEEGQEFEKQFKAEKTPYILFYQRVSSS